MRILLNEVWLGEDNIVFYSIIIGISEPLKAPNL